MIGYCPLDEDPIERPRPSREVSVPVQEKLKILLVEEKIRSVIMLFCSLLRVLSP